MSLNADLQILTQPGAIGNQTYSLASNFNPKAVILWAVPAAADGNLAGRMMGYGFGTYRSSVVNQCFTCGRGLNAAATSNTARGSGEDAILIILTNTTGTSTADLEIRLVSMQTGGTSQVVLNWVNLHTTASIKVFMLVLGGSDITDALVGSFTSSTAGTTQDVTVSSGFGKPDLLFTMNSGNQPSPGSRLLELNDNLISLGWCIKGQPGRAFGFSQDHANTNSVTQASQRSDRCMLEVNGALASYDLVGKLDVITGNWPTDGFRVVYDVTPGFTDRLFYLALRGTFQAKDGSNTALLAGSTQDNFASFPSVDIAGVVTGAYASGTAATLVVPLPAGLTAGEHLSMEVVIGDNANIAINQGWTIRQSYTNGTGMKVVYATKSAAGGGSDVAPTISGLTGGGVVACGARIIAVPGVDVSVNDGVDVIGASTTSSTNTATAASITPSGQGYGILAIKAETNGDTSGSPTWGTFSGSGGDPTFTEFFDNSDGGLGTRETHVGLGFGVDNTGAATGARTATQTGTPGATPLTIGFQVSLKPLSYSSFTPVLGFLFGWNLTAQNTVNNSATDLVGIGVGATDGTDQGWCGWTEDDAAATMISNSQLETDHILDNWTPTTPAVQSTATGSLQASSLRLTWDDLDTVSREYQWLALGSAPVVAAASRPQIIVSREAQRRASRW